MSDDVAKEQLIEHFGPLLRSDDALLSECLNMCKTFALSPEDLFYKWEAYNFNTKHTLTLATVRDWRAQLSREKEREAEMARSKAIRAGLMNIDMRGRTGSRGMGIPSASNVMNIGRMGVVSSGVGTIAGTSEASKTTRPAAAGPSRVKYEGAAMDENSRKGRGYRYMFEKVSERSDFLDDRIDELAELIHTHYEIEDFGNPADSTGQDCVVVGRITSDWESTPSSKLSETTVMLESSRAMGSGGRVPLRFDTNLLLRGAASGTGGVNLFPGAIVALRGSNGGGGSFLAKEALALPPLKQKPRNGSSKTEPFDMVIASGPFTSDADLEYKPWRSMLKALRESKPAVLLLCGPFLDSSHILFRTGDVDKTPSEYFQILFVEPLRKFLDASPGSIVLIVPNVRDIVSLHAVYPQAEFGTEVFDDPRVRLLPNPAKFSINGRDFAVSSVDVLYHLRTQQFTKRTYNEVASTTFAGDDSDVMAGLCRDVLRHRTFYPIFPSPHGLSHEVNLDVSHMDGLVLASMEEPAPDVLILPSRLKHFSKIVDGTVVVNPSFVAKETYVLLQAGGRNDTTAREDFKIDIVKISE